MRGEPDGQPIMKMLARAERDEGFRGVQRRSRRSKEQSARFCGPKFRKSRSGAF